MQLAALVLAAGRGRRVRPLSDERPKPLFPVNNRTLLDLALDVVHPHTHAVAVNARHLADQIIEHVQGTGVHISHEHESLGTAGAVGNLREWIAGRPLLVVNADAYRPGPIDELLEGWDGDRLRLLVVHDPARGDFGAWRFAGASLLPARAVESLQAVPAGLFEVLWRDEYAADRLQFVEHVGKFIDCGTPADYLAANLHASGGSSVIGDGAIVQGDVVRSVVWPQARVERDERLVDSIRTTQGLTVIAR